MTALKDITSGIGTVSYNTVNFPAIRNVTVSMVPHYDESGRVRSYNIYTFTVTATFWAANETTQSTGFDSAYKLLSANGGALNISGVGIGTFNVGGVDSDVIWGPRPKMLSVTPIAGFIASEVVWQVEVALPTCPQTAEYHKLLEFNFSIAYNIDERGLTTRTVSGYAKIPQSKVSSTSSVVTRTADSWRETILGLVILPLGFSRSSSWVDGPDRSRLDFTITDKQVDSPEPLPPGVVPGGIDITVSLSNSPAIQFRIWKISISGSIEHAPGYSANWGWQIAYLIITSKISSLAVNGTIAMPSSFRAGRQLYKRVTTFSVEFTLMNQSTDFNPLDGGGLWQPVPGSDWTTWKTSLAQHFGPRGVAGLTNTMPQGDALVSLCDSPVTNISIGGQNSDLTGYGGSNTNTLFGCPGATPQNSYMDYRNTLKVSRQQSYSHQKSVQEFDPQATQLTTGGLPTDPGVKMGGAFFGTPDTVQIQSIPTDRICMEGAARRIGFEPAIPSLILADGRVPIEVDRQVLIEPDGQIGACKIYVAAWRISYEIPGGVSASPLPPQPNPLLNSG